MRLKFFAFALILGTTTISAQAPKPAVVSANVPYVESASPVTLLKARIAQLEAQVTQLQGDNTMCAARVVLATQPAAQKAFDDTRVALEKEAGCAIDWKVVPPACKK